MTPDGKYDVKVGPGGSLVRASGTGNPEDNKDKVTVGPFGSIVRVDQANPRLFG